MEEKQTYTAEEVRIIILKAWIMLEGAKRVQLQMPPKDALYGILNDQKTKAQQTIQQFLPEFLELSRH